MSLKEKEETKFAKLNTPLQSSLQLLPVQVRHGFLILNSVVILKRLQLCRAKNILRPGKDILRPGGPKSVPIVKPPQSFHGKASAKVSAKGNKPSSPSKPQSLPVSGKSPKSAPPPLSTKTTSSKVSSKATKPYSSSRGSGTPCINSPTDRQCWGKYDINTDYYDVTPDTGVTVEV